MKVISQLRGELSGLSAAAQVPSGFGTSLVGKLLSLEEIEMVGGGDGTCSASGQQSHSMTGSTTQFSQTGGQYSQNSGNYTMSC